MRCAKPVLRHAAMAQRRVWRQHQRDNGVAAAAEANGRGADAQLILRHAATAVRLPFVLLSLMLPRAARR